MAAERGPSTPNSELARLDPGAVFATPEQVRDHAELTTEEKIDILSRWAYDDAEIAVAVEEGMPDAGGNGVLRRILLALNSLADVVDVERTAPTKQHGLSISPGAKALG